MPKYAYKALNKEGKQIFGVVQADSKALAINDVRTLGLYPTTVREATKRDEKRARKDKKGIDELYFGGVKTKEIVVMTRQLSTLIDAGLPLLRSVNVSFLTDGYCPLARPKSSRNVLPTKKHGHVLAHRRGGYVKSLPKTIQKNKYPRRIWCNQWASDALLR